MAMISGSAEPRMPRKPRLLMVTMKPVKTLSVMWPARILPNRRTESEIGRLMNEMNSIGATMGRI
ncbi:hypothetical protein D3C86_2025530 [compost metagenome]